jgi:hypothetical protein
MRLLRAACSISLLAACHSYVGPLTARDDSDTDYAYTPPPPPPQPVFGDVVKADATLPMSGGTLTILSGDQTAVAADPERDTLHVIDLAKNAELATIPLSAHDEPGRIVEDAAHRVHVVLRGGGAVLTLVAPWTTSVRRAVCSTPRGIAYQASGDVVHVACATGELVTLPAASGPPTRTVQLDDDLRDVVVLGDKLLVSRLRSAEVLTVNGDGAIIGRATPQSFDRLSSTY